MDTEAAVAPGVHETYWLGDDSDFRTRGHRVRGFRARTSRSSQQLGVRQVPHRRLPCPCHRRRHRDREDLRLLERRNGAADGRCRRPRHRARGGRHDPEARRAATGSPRRLGARAAATTRTTSRPSWRRGSALRSSGIRADGVQRPRGADVAAGSDPASCAFVFVDGVGKCIMARASPRRSGRDADPLERNSGRRPTGCQLRLAAHLRALPGRVRP